MDGNAGAAQGFDGVGSEVAAVVGAVGEQDHRADGQQVALRGDLAERRAEVGALG